MSLVALFWITENIPASAITNKIKRVPGVVVTDNILWLHNICNSVGSDYIDM